MQPGANPCNLPVASRSSLCRESATNYTHTQVATRCNLTTTHLLDLMATRSHLNHTRGGSSHPCYSSTKTLLARKEKLAPTQKATTRERERRKRDTTRWERSSTNERMKITKSQQALITHAQPQGSTSKLRSEISGSNSLIESKILQIPGPGSTGNLTFQTGKGQFPHTH